MVVTIISSIIIAIFIVGLAISRYYTRREKQVNDSSYNVARYCRRQFTSTSCDNMIPISIKTNQQLHETINETTHIIKNSFSWPEVAMAHQHDQSSPTISSSSSTDLSSIEPTSLTFSLRWDDNIKSLFVRVLSARDLYIHKRHRQPLIIDSYVRIQLLNTPSNFLLLNF
jgi:type II secretory pathway pseudopilin PulG